MRGGPLTFRLSEPCQHEFAYDWIVFEPLGFLELGEQFDSDGRNHAPLRLNLAGRFVGRSEGLDARRLAHYVEKYVTLLSAGQDKMIAVTALDVFAVYRGSEFVIARVAFAKRGPEAFEVLLRWIDPKVDVFRKSRRALEHSCLAANQQVFDSLAAKALEKVCGHALLSGPEYANASASYGATAPGA